MNKLLIESLRHRL